MTTHSQQAKGSTPGLAPCVMSARQRVELAQNLIGGLCTPTEETVVIGWLKIEIGSGPPLKVHEKQEAFESETRLRLSHANGKKD